MTAERVTLGELDGIAELAGHPDDSAIVFHDGRHLLRGRFALRLAGVTSDFVDFGALRAEVDVTGPVPALRAITRCMFTFAPVLKLQRGAADPWLSASRASLFRAAADAAPLLLSLDDPALSLIPDLAAALPQRMYFPSRSGVAFRALQPISADGVLGYFVMPLPDGGFGLRFGNLDAGAVIDHFGVAAVSVPRDARVVFRFDAAASASAPDHDTQPQPVAIAADESLAAMNVILADSTGGVLRQRSAGRSALRCSRAEIGEGWFSVVAMHASQADASVSRLHAKDGADATALVARPANLRFHLPLMHADGSLLHAQPAHFAYRDAELARPAAARRPRDRQHGLRIRGLHTSAGSQARLDADWAIAAVENGRLNFRAGTALDVRGRRCEPVLVPKPSAADDSRRELAIPAGIAELRCVTARVPATSPIVFDTALDTPLWISATLDIPPSGTPGTRAEAFTDRSVASGGYQRWQLQPRGGQVRLRATDDGVFPANGQGWPQQFDGGSAGFALAEHPGSRLHINPGPAGLATTATAATSSAATSTAVTTRELLVQGSPKEILVYTALTALLVLHERLLDYYRSVRAANIADNRIRIELQQLDDEAVFKNREVDSLLAVFCDAAPGGPGDAQMRGFIDLHREAGKTQLVWPFAPGLAVLLWDALLAPDPYASGIARGRLPGCRPGMAIDLSSIRSLDFADFGWSAADRVRFLNEPLLWPRLARQTGAQLDPSDPAWRGIVFRDLPLVLAVDPQAVNENAPPFLRAFYDSLNSRLMLDYGWKDESGSTWIGGYADDAGLSLAPESWRSVLDIQLLRFSTRGASGRIIGAHGEVRVVLPKLLSAGAEPRPLMFRGAFSVGIANGVKLERIEFAPEQPEDFATSSVPGFDSVQVLRFASDLESMQLTLRLKPSAALAAVLPFLGGAQTLDVTSLVPLSGGGALRWAFTLGAEIRTNLFGRFAVAIQSVELGIGEGLNTLTLQARIHLGSASFASAGARLLLRETAGGSWSLDIVLDEISGALEVGDFRLAGSLVWSDEAGSAGPLGAAEIATAAGRDFWGEVALRTGGLIDASLLLRIGNRGELSYWIGAVRTDELKFGSAATLREPALLIAHHVDFDGRLRELVGDVQTSIAEAVRPPDQGANRAWLARWKPSADIGTVIAGSGFLNIHDVVAAAPDNPRPGDFTCLLVTDSGLFRAEATVMLFNAARTRFGLAVDLKRKRFSAGIQLPEFSYGAFKVRAGHIALGLGWGEPYFLLSVGWPEATGGDPLNRDWSKSVMIRWEGAFPLNTFMGGVRAELKSNALVLGFALRAGWTCDYKVGGQAAGGEASLGVMLGGIVEIYFGNRSARLATAPLPWPVLRDAMARTRRIAAAIAAESAAPASLAALQFNMAHVEALLPAMQAFDVAARVVFVGDIWGKASVHVFGVTLAAIDVGAHAAFIGCARLLPEFQIVRLAARISLHVSIRIGCVRFSARADIDITIRDMGGDCLPAPAALAMPSRSLRSTP